MTAYFGQLLISTFMILFMTNMSFQSLRVWHAHPRFRIRQFSNIVMCGSIFFLLNLSSLFFDDVYSRHIVCSLAAATFYMVARSNSRGSGLWANRRVLPIAQLALLTAALSLPWTNLQSPLLVLIFASLTYQEQWKVGYSLTKEVLDDSVAMREKLRTLTADRHNRKFNPQVDGDNYHEAG